MLKHISYSQYNTFENCPRSWYLGKVVKAEEKPTWFLPVGTAVHTMIEDNLDGEMAENLKTAEDYFFPLIEKQMLIEPDTSKWLTGSANGVAIRDGLALQQVKDCFEKALEFLDQIDVWEVEWDASGPLPGLEVPVVAYVDIIGEHKKYGPVIADWKTGSQKPSSNFQLETYAALLRSGKEFQNLTLDRPINFKGLWMMLKPGASKARPIEITATPEEVGAKYQKVYAQMVKKVYATKHAKFKCEFCFHSENCLVNAGPTARAKYYDKSAQDGIPF